MNIDARAFLLVSLVASGLFGCSEPQKTDVEKVTSVTPTEAPVGAHAIARGPVPLAPVELTLDERKNTMTPTSSCNLERAGGKLFAGTPIDVARSAGALAVTGWVADKDGGSVPPNFDIRIVALDGSRAWRVPGVTGGKRDDVLSLLGGAAEFFGAGFAVPVDLAQIPQGTYRLYVVFGPAESLRVCDNGRSLAIQ